MKAYNKMVRLMKSSSFAESWQQTYNYAWKNLQASQNYIKKMGVQEEGGMNADDEVQIEDIEIEIAENGP